MGLFIGGRGGESEITRRSADTEVKIPRKQAWQAIKSSFWIVIIFAGIFFLLGPDLAYLLIIFLLAFMVYRTFIVLLRKSLKSPVFLVLYVASIVMFVIWSKYCEGILYLYMPYRYVRNNTLRLFTWILRGGFITAGLIAILSHSLLIASMFREIIDPHSPPVRDRAPWFTLPNYLLWFIDRKSVIDAWRKSVGLDITKAPPVIQQHTAHVLARTGESTAKFRGDVNGTDSQWEYVYSLVENGDAITISALKGSEFFTGKEAKAFYYQVIGVPEWVEKHGRKFYGTDDFRSYLENKEWRTQWNEDDL